MGVNKEARSIKTAKIGAHITKTGKIRVKIGVNRIKRVRFERTVPFWKGNGAQPTQHRKLWGPATHSPKYETNILASSLIKKNPYCFDFKNLCIIASLFSVKNDFIEIRQLITAWCKKLRASLQKRLSYFILESLMICLQRVFSLSRTVLFQTSTVSAIPLLLLKQ